jgi:thymidylate synthase
VALNATNAHLYGSAIDAVDEVLKRGDFDAPTLVLSDNIKQVTLDDYQGAFERIEPDDIWLEGYQSHPAIKTEMVK